MLVQYFRTMSLRRYFQPATTLSLASQTLFLLARLPRPYKRQAKRSCLPTYSKRYLAAEREWRKASTSFTPEDRARIGKYASENGNAPAVRLVWRASPFTRGGRVWRRAYTRLVPAALYSAVQSDSYT